MSIAAVWRSLIAFTPESVSMSRKMSSFLSRKVLFPASAMAAARRSTGWRLSFCTMRTLCSSRGMSIPVKNLMLAIFLLSFSFIAPALWRRRTPEEE